MQEKSCPYLPLHCEHLRLREFRHDDLAPFATYRANPDIARYQDWDEFCLEDALGFYEILRHLRFGVAGTWYQIAIARQTSPSTRSFHRPTGAEPPSAVE